MVGVLLRELPRMLQKDDFDERRFSVEWPERREAESGVPVVAVDERRDSLRRTSSWALRSVQARMPSSMGLTCWRSAIPTAMLP